MNGRTAQPFVETSPQKLGRNRHQERCSATGQVALDEAKGDKTGPVVDRRRGVGGGRRGRRPNRRRSRHADAPKPETRVVVVGDSDFAANGVLGIQGNRDLFMNTVGWLSQQENLISIRPKEADDRRITLTATQQTNIAWLSLLIIPGAASSGPASTPGGGGGSMRGLRSTIALLVVLVGLGAYIYFVTWKTRPAPTAATKEKVFAGVEADKIEEVKIKSAVGRRHDAQEGRRTRGRSSRRSRRQRPRSEVSRPHDARSGSSRSSRVVDENPANLKDYGLDAPRIEIDFKARRRQALRTAARRRQDADRRRSVREAQRREAVFLIPDFQEASLNKSTFDLRDKTVLKFERDKVDGVEVDCRRQAARSSRRTAATGRSRSRWRRGPISRTVGGPRRPGRNRRR